MVPLLLRPLLSGDCEIEMDFDVGANDSSMQLLQAAAAANHAQAIVITLLEQYDHIFGEGCLSSQVYTDTDESASGSEEEADDESGEEDESFEDDDGTEGSDISNDDEDDDDDEDDVMVVMMMKNQAVKAVSLLPMIGMSIRIWVLRAQVRSPLNPMKM
ncbi:hypothetical protein F3Y22_tig00110457pilonHSYRG00215 [Hibiscus syriacus]|uniref:Uncharacterized protein n=1 Tax=Hibiscus syriacus TaxID=106335 RepID=A0A6A3AK29_HIBSY|nr:hypothetical protein F3Y22_tig00110457pilonHSYRG00215 [Hibiscus syriacus]